MAILQSMSIDEISVLILDNAKRFTNSKYGFAGYIDPNTGYLIVPTHTREIWNGCKVHSIEFREFRGLWGWRHERKLVSIIDSRGHFIDELLTKLELKT